MPGLITHLLCGHATAKQVDKELSDVIKKYPESYNLGTQGPDIFFYYLPGFLNKETLNLGLLLHKNNTQDYILSMIESTKKLEGEQKDIATAYICGYLTHYSLDASTHPYIYYKTGFRQKGDKIKAIKYSLYHRKFETAIDVLLLNHFTGKTPSEKSLWQFFNVDDTQEVVLGKIISSSLNSAYGRNISPKRTTKILKYVVLATKYLQSKEGKRKKIMEFMEDMSIGEHTYSSLIHDQVITDNIDYLNMSKDFWHNPWDNVQLKQDSFVELYNKGLENGINFANSAFSCINDKMPTFEFGKIIGNLSMASGEDCTEPLSWKHHNIIFNE